MLLNYTTKIDASQTISEIQKKLSSYGISAMMTEYDGRQVSAVSFRLIIDGKPLSFKLPCNWRAVEQILKRVPRARLKIKKGEDVADQAVRTAWRVILVWVEAQLALVEINMVTLPQIFLPYAMMPNGKTLGESVEENPGFLLETGKN